MEAEMKNDREYLTQVNMQAHLSALVEACLKERPENVFEFMSAYAQRKADDEKSGAGQAKK